jgi:hypothetical protein
MGEMKNAYKISVGELEGYKPLTRPNHRWENNIKINLNSDSVYRNDFCAAVYVPAKMLEPDLLREAKS